MQGFSFQSFSLTDVTHGDTRWYLGRGSKNEVSTPVNGKSRQKIRGPPKAGTFCRKQTKAKQKQVTKYRPHRHHTLLFRLKKMGSRKVAVFNIVPQYHVKRGGCTRVQGGARWALGRVIIAVDVDEILAVGPVGTTTSGKLCSDLLVVLSAASDDAK